MFPGASLSSGPGEQRRDKHNRAKPARRQFGPQGGQGRAAVERKPGDDGKPHASGDRMMI